MFKNYLKTAIRNLFRHKAYSFINVSGLAIGMTCCFLIFLFVQDELSYDSYHKNADQIYRLTRETELKGAMGNIASTAYPMAQALKNDYPEIKNYVRFLPSFTIPVIRYQDKYFQEERFFMADASVFEVFNFFLIKGNPGTALQEPNSVVITEETAKKYFGDTDPLGKVISYDNLFDLKITGILQALPPNSHFTFDFLASMSTLEAANTGLTAGSNAWYSNPFYTYLLIPDKDKADDLEKKLPEFVEKYMGDGLSHIGLQLKLQLQPITKIHLYSKLLAEIEPNNDIRYVYIFSVIAFFILLIACINFINLTTAKFTDRSKEVGMRKILGAHRLNLIKQFIGESVFVAIIALVFALALVELFLPVFNTVANKELVINYKENTLIPFALLGMTFFVGIFAGSYPAFFLSMPQPVAVLKGTVKTWRTTTFVRKILVVTQFTISIVLIFGTLIVYGQLEFIRDKKLGFNKDHIMTIPLRDYELRFQYNYLKQELLQYPNIVGVTASSGLPGRLIDIDTFPVIPEGVQKDENWFMSTLMVDKDYIETLGIELLAGRDFSEDYTTDLASGFILNETAVKTLGWEEPLGKQLVWIYGMESNMQKQGTVIGVIKDFHIRSLHQPIEPLILHVFPERFACISLKFRPENVSETLAFLKNKWKEFDPNHPFGYYFLDEDLEKLYAAERKQEQIFEYFSFLAIFIASLGLLGLVSFVAEQRTKEIGIRKILGASVSNIVVLLSKDFTKMVMLANIIAWPMAYYAMNHWLQDFAYRIEIGISTFLMAGISAFIIALATVSLQAIKTALANPVETLRYE